MKKCDIIIPIYNAYDYTKDCITSVIKHTNLEHHTLVLINDCSPDARLQELLQEVKKKHSKLNIKVLENATNLGFVQTVNKGMQLSKRDVVLLNSDTEVTPNWLEKMGNCAYSRKEIATVTPLTNNGSIASVPNFISDNEIPEGYTVERYASLIEKISFQKYPELTTGVGFCMYIKRSILDCVGYFDAEAYGIGYGEETDFCYRCSDFGYTHVLCDDTFVYHKGTQSFKEKYDDIYDEHMKTLIGRYKKYNDKTNDFVLGNPIEYIQNNIKIHLYGNNRKNVLYVVHSWFDNQDTRGAGGAPLHVYDIIKQNETTQNSFVLSPRDNGVYRLYCYYKEGEFFLDFSTQPYSTSLHFYNTSYEEMIDKIITCFQIDTVHVHQLLGHSFSLMEAIKKHKLYSVITLHDFYYFCPLIHLMREFKVYCKDPYQEIECQKCLAYQYKVDNNVIGPWRQECQRFLSQFNSIVCPSVDTKERYETYYPNLSVQVIEHGVNATTSEYVPTLDGTFHIAFIGIIGIHKGRKILKDTIKSAQLSTSKIHVHLFGSSDDDYLCHNHRNYTYHGLYEKNELPNLLAEHKIDLICIMPVWPETYSYTLTEAIMANIPVIATNIGAVGERVKTLKCGWLVDYQVTVTEFIEKLKAIANNQKEYEKVVKQVRKIKFKTVEAMAKEYEEMYQFSSGRKKAMPKEERYQFLHQAIPIRTDTVDAVWKLARYHNLISFYEKVRNSKVWRGMSKLRVDRFVVATGRKLSKKSVDE